MEGHFGYMSLFQAKYMLFLTIPLIYINGIDKLINGVEISLIIIAAELHEREATYDNH